MQVLCLQLGARTVCQDHVLLLDKITFYTFLSELMSDCIIDKWRENRRREREKSFVVSSL